MATNSPPTPRLYPRLIEARIASALADTRVVLLAGPHQVGKTTWVCQMALPAVRYPTLDEQLILLSFQDGRFA